MLLGSAAALFATRWPLIIQSFGSLLIAAAGVALVSGTDAIGAPFHGGVAVHLGADGLTGVFLLALGAVAAPALFFASSYLGESRPDRVVAALSGVFVAVLALALCARDLLSFLVAWELMTIVPAAIILITRHDVSSRRTVFVYVAVTHVAGAGVWTAMLLLAQNGALDGRPVDGSSGLGAVIAVAALIGFGGKAGVAPLHVWLPRAHPIAPAHISALMSGVMLKVAIYGLMRVLLEWLETPVWVGCVVIGLGAVSAVGGVIYAVFQDEFKRLLAWSSIENIGIVLLGLGASLVLRDAGATEWAGLALAASLLHAVNHAFFKGLLFLGAGAIDAVVHGLDLNHLGGLLRRMPWTAGAVLVGAVAIAGVPPLNGFVSEWLTFQSLFQVTSTAGAGSGLLAALAFGALALTAALGLVCFARAIGLMLVGQPRRAACATAGEASLPMRVALVGLALGCLALGAAPGFLVEQLVLLTPGAATARGPGIAAPQTGTLPTLGLAATLLAVALLARLVRGSSRATTAPAWACGQRVDPALNWSGAGFTKPIQLVLAPILRPRSNRVAQSSGGVVQSVSYSSEVPLLVEEELYGPSPACRRAAVSDGCPSDPVRPDQLVRHLPCSPARDRVRRAAPRGARMTGQAVIAGVVQIGGGLAAAPLLVGLTQATKARLQGRRGATVFQPYRELRRLWGKSLVDPAGTGPIYRAAPAVVVASLVVAVLLVPVAGQEPGWPVGSDMLVLAGVLSLARLAIAIAAFDTGSGFALQGASRDLAIAVSVEVALLLALAAVALGASTTDLSGMAAASAGWSVWASPAAALAAGAFALVAVAETGRQPIDNPDTHLELTMIHEGPLLEYAGRDQAMLQWALSARHWVMLALATAVFMPHPQGFWAQLAILPFALVAGCLLLAITETLIAKIRILLAPRLLGVGAAVALAAIVARLMADGV